MKVILVISLVNVGFSTSLILNNCQNIRTLLINKNDALAQLYVHTFKNEKLIMGNIYIYILLDT